jgi:lipopolysaccharide export system permease protein
MNVLRIHVARTVAFAALLVMAILLGLNFLAVLVEQFGDIRGAYTFWEVLKYATWRLPGLAANSIAFVALIGCLSGLGILANHNELTVMRASGVSLLQIIGMVMIPVLVLVALGLGLQEVAAFTDRQAENARTLALSAEQKKAKKSFFAKKKGNPESMVFQEQSVWNRHENEFVRFDRVLPDGRVYGVLRIAFSEQQQLLSLQHARKGVFKNEGWRLEEVVTRTFAEDAFSDETLEVLRWESDLTPERLLFVSREPEKLSVAELADYSTFLQQQGRDNRAYQLEYWKRVLQPLSLLSLMLIAASFVFGSLRQVSVAQRIFVGVIVGVGFHILQDVVGTSSLVFGFSPLSGVVLPIAACAAAGMVLLYRVR